MQDVFNYDIPRPFHENFSSQNRIKKRYCSCIGRVNYEVGVENDGMSNIGLTFLTPHDNEVCRTDEIEVVQRVARSEILSRAT